MARSQKNSDLFSPSTETEKQAVIMQTARKSREERNLGESSVKLRQSGWRTPTRRLLVRFETR
jgi:hypothetical protein